MYSKEETNSLLGTITHILPVGPDTCKEVAELHVGEFPSMHCKPEGLVAHHELTDFRQQLQVQSHLEMPGILVQLGHIQCT